MNAPDFPAIARTLVEAIRVPAPRVPDTVPALPGRPWHAIERGGRHLVVPHGWPRPPHVLEANPYRPDADAIAAGTAHAVSHFSHVVETLRALSFEVDLALSAPTAGSAQRLRKAALAAHRALEQADHA
jgi:hypothetical protein